MAVGSLEAAEKRGKGIDSVHGIICKKTGRWSVDKREKKGHVIETVGIYRSDSTVCFHHQLTSKLLPTVNCSIHFNISFVVVIFQRIKISMLVLK